MVTLVRWNELRLMVRRWSKQVVDIEKLRSAPRGFIRFFRDWRRYSRMEGAESARVLDSYPCIHDATKTTAFDAHYLYQDVWAARHIRESGARLHVDVASRVDFAAFLTAIVNVIFCDLRPLRARIEGMKCVQADVLNLPFRDCSVGSLSCLHVAEHVGLGRYGDALDPMGTAKTAAELCRVLAPGGSLYFSVPVGKERLCYNAHRIHSPQRIRALFDGLRLEEFSAIDDRGEFHKGVELHSVEASRYACGLFRFVK